MIFWIGLAAIALFGANVNNLSARLVRTNWGKMAVWAAYGIWGIWPANSIIDAVEKCQESYHNDEVSWVICVNATLDATPNTIAYGFCGAAVNAAIVDFNARDLSNCKNLLG